MKSSGLVGLLLLAAPLAASAADNIFHFGPMVGWGRGGVSDPDGPTGTATTIIPSLIATLDWDRDVRLFGQLYTDRYKLKPNGTSKIAQDVKQTGINTSVQYRLRVARDFRPWIGAGLGYAQNSFSKRYTVDKDGYLAARYPDRDESAINFVINAAISWEVNDRFRVALIPQYEYPINGSAKMLSVGLALLF